MFLPPYITFRKLINGFYDFILRIYNEIYHENLFWILSFLCNSYLTPPPPKRKTVYHTKYWLMI
jgi:hypothetical protein